MAAYRQVYDSRRLQADCQEPGSAPEPCTWHSSVGYLFTFYHIEHGKRHKHGGVPVCLAVCPID